MPPKETWKPVSLNVPPKKPATVAVAPGAEHARPCPWSVSVTVPVAPVASAIENGPASMPVDSAPPKQQRVAACRSPCRPRPCRPRASSTSAAPPLAVSRTTEVGPEELTISTVGTSMLADAPLKVSVKPPLPAPETVAVPAKPGIALTAAAMLALLIGGPPAPIDGGGVAVDRTLNDCVRGVEAGEGHRLLLVAALERVLDAGRGVVLAADDRDAVDAAEAQRGRSRRWCHSR